MHDKFLIAAAIDSKLWEFKEADRNTQKRQSLFAIAAGLILLILMYASNFAVQGNVLE